IWLDSFLSKSIIWTEKYHCTEEVISIISILNVQSSVFYRPRDVRDQLVGLCERAEVELKPNPNSGDLLPIQKSIVSGFFMTAARISRFRESYQKVKYGDPGRTIYVHPSSSLFRNGKKYMRQIMEIQPEWLLEATTYYYSKTEFDVLGDKKKMSKNRQAAQTSGTSVITESNLLGKRNPKPLGSFGDPETRDPKITSLSLELTATLTASQLACPPTKKLTEDFHSDTFGHKAHEKLLRMGGE
ncbi:1519_t:CDS:2, partial [Diversispora eburnea]